MKKQYIVSIFMSIVVVCSIFSANSSPLHPTQYQKILRVGMDVEWTKMYIDRVAVMKQSSAITARSTCLMLF